MRTSLKLSLAPICSLVLTSTCKEAAGPQPNTFPYPVQWIEWPAAVTPGEPVVLRVSSLAQCPLTITYGVSVSGNDVHITATAHDHGGGCPDLGGTGAGYDALLTLPTLAAGPGGLPTRFNIWATVARTDHYPGNGYQTGYERMIGWFTLQFSAPDTTTRFAGNVILTVDSLGCWRAMPWSVPPQPRWVFAKPLSLVPDRAWWQAFLSGSMVTVDPPVCGNTVAIDPAALEVDLTPNPYLAPTPSRP